jgi:chemotaxis protein MotB
MSSPAKNARPIIIVKRKKKGAFEHHGGAWKVAYADFVTAMMAFFLVMWLVTAVSKEQRAAIFEYFKNPSMESGKSVKAAPGQMGPGGASTSPINLGGGLDALRSRVSKVTDIGATAALVLRDQSPPAGKNNKTREQTEAEAREQVREAEHKKLETLMEELKEAVSKSQALEPFKDQLLLDITPEGIRIQIVDAQNRPMFDIGSARLRDYTQSILKELAPYLTSVPNRISITGHTDIRAYPGQGGYSNWELSADRANAARRALVGAGLPDEKIARVVGLASSVLFNRADPQNAINRRISIVIMTKQAEEEALKTDVAKAIPDAPADMSAAPAADGISPAALQSSPEPLAPGTPATSPAGPATGQTSNTGTPLAATAPARAAPEAALPPRNLAAALAAN